MLKMLKINVPLEIKGDPNDLEDLKNRVFEYLQVGIEEDDLDFTVEDDENEEFDSEE